jgi:hypothetical protein
MGGTLLFRGFLASKILGKKKIFSLAPPQTPQLLFQTAEDARNPPGGDV